MSVTHCAIENRCVLNPKKNIVISNVSEKSFSCAESTAEDFSSYLVRNDMNIIE